MCFVYTLTRIQRVHSLHDWLNYIFETVKVYRKCLREKESAQVKTLIMMCLQYSQMK